MGSSYSARRWFLRTALSYLGSPYRWGGDDPSGFDCSGFVVECLKSVGLLDESEDLSAEGLRQRFAAHRTDLPVTGALMFFLNEGGTSASHVVICLDEYYQIGASGGDSSTIDVAGAWRQNAFVKIRPLRLGSDRREILDPFRGWDMRRAAR